MNYLGLPLILLLLSTLIIDFVGTTHNADGQSIGSIDNGDCALVANISTYPVYYNSSSRNNPDGTYYAGDAFHYIIIYGLKEIGPAVCSNLETSLTTSGSISLAGHTLEDNASITGFEELAREMCRQAAEEGLRCMYGHAEVSIGAKPGEHYLTFMISVDHKHCYIADGKVKCTWHRHEAEAKYRAHVLKPNIFLDVVKANVTDSDGYWIRNLDQTYYLWDGINVLHIVRYKWQNERVGTLHTKTTKVYDLKIEKEFECRSGGCSYTLQHPGLSPWNYNFNYGSGSTLYNATGSKDYGRHTFIYKVELFNIHRYLNATSNSTDALVVKYEPVYTNYPYSMLIDDNAWAYGNRLAVALHYFGSRGGEKDDTGGMHELRRSKVNGYQYSGYAFNPVWPVVLHERLKWLGAVSVDSNSLLTDSKNSTSMFVKSGYGKILFAYPIEHFMLKTRFENATLDAALQSVVFGGFNVKNTTEFRYVYPAVKFNTRVSVAAYHSDGRINNIPLSIDMIPQFEHGATYLHDYLNSKVIHDTGDRKFAEIVLSDMYGRGNSIAGNGFIKLKARFTSLLIPDSAKLVWGDKMNIPLNLALDALSPYMVKISAGSISRTFNATLFQFYSDYDYIVNLDNDNKLNVTRYGDLVVVPFDKKFGEVTLLKVNGKEHSNCMLGCSLVISKSEPLLVEAFNIWGGRAYAELEPVQEKMKSDIDMVQLATTLAILLGAFIIARIVARFGDKTR